MDPCTGEDSKKPQENRKGSHGSPPRQLRRDSCGKGLLHLLYAVGMATIVTMVISHFIEEYNSYDKTFSVENAARLDAALKLQISMDK